MSFRSYIGGVQRAGARGLRIFVGTIVVVTVVTLEEVAQLWIYTRRFELIDLLAGYLGIATAEIALRRQSFLVIEHQEK